MLWYFHTVFDLRGRRQQFHRPRIPASIPLVRFKLVHFRNCYTREKNQYTRTFRPFWLIMDIAQGGGREAYREGSKPHRRLR